ncbi:CxxH/CxxC protein [Risungbinella massiliensis]|uniref:CxxH/CxxC protein n=1 Tax=Risungbinella massiliensis TaxID=1329796 RepID=UPI0005CBD184|nr:CxxH/CxxC protein [Risungbinella massiliensis]
MNAACAEHIDYLMDDLVEETMTAPSLELIPDEERGKTKCNWCNQPAEYYFVFEYGLNEGE